MISIINKNRDRNTTIFGILQFVGVIATEAQNLFDGDDLTTLNWKIVALSITTLYGLLKVKNKVEDQSVIGTD